MTLIYESGPELQWTKVSELVVGKRTVLRVLVNFEPIKNLSILYYNNPDRAYFQLLRNVKTTEIEPSTLKLQSLKALLPPLHRSCSVDS